MGTKPKPVILVCRDGVRNNATKNTHVKTQNRVTGLTLTRDPTRPSQNR